MKKLLEYTVALLVAMIVWTACSKGDDNDNNLPDDGRNATVILQDVAYTLTVECDGSIYRVDSTEYEEISVMTPKFTEEDVAKPLVMTVTGENVSGTLTLKNIDGVFSGTLQAPVGASDSLLLTGVVEVPAADVDASWSNVSLDSLVQKCGHRYTAKFYYKNTEPARLVDSKAYFEFIMSPCQRGLQVNNDRYYMSADGRLWLALEAPAAVLTNFYRIASNNVKGGNLYTIDRDGFVDLGLRNVLWSDKNVGAENIWDSGDYYYWDEAMTCISAPLELPRSGESSVDGNDCEDLWRLYYYWDEYNGHQGMKYVATGWEHDREPFVFFPAAGGKVAGGINYFNEYGLYWSCNDFSEGEAYRMYFRNTYYSPNSLQKKYLCKICVRPVIRGNAGTVDYEEEEEDVRELEPFYPYDYPTEDVVAWYTCKDLVNMEEWALFLFKNNQYLLTQYIASSDSRVIYYDDDYTVEGAAEGDYDNIDIVANVGRSQESAHFEGGKGMFLQKEFVREAGDVPEAAEYTKINGKDPEMYFPYDDGYEVEKVVAWYKQTNATDDDRVVLYMFKDNRFAIVTSRIEQDGIAGDIVASGGYELATGSTLDYYNMTVNVSVDETGINTKLPITIKDGKIQYLMYNLELQDRDILEELLGL